jgi:hypothetical protein
MGENRDGEPDPRANCPLGFSRVHMRVLDKVLASRFVVVSLHLVVSAIAVVLLTSGAFIVISIAYRMQQGQWLYRAGSFETSSVDEAEANLDERTLAFERCIAVIERNEILTRQMSKRDRALVALVRSYETLVGRLERASGSLALGP